MKKSISNFKKAEELVEWAADKIKRTPITYHSSEGDWIITAEDRCKLAKQILFQKDEEGRPILAWIDREEMQKTGSVVIGTESERNFWMAGFKARGEICRKTYINLAEALKKGA